MFEGVVVSGWMDVFWVVVGCYGVVDDVDVGFDWLVIYDFMDVVWVGCVLVFVGEVFELVLL